MILDKNFREFIELLNEHKVQYLVIGGYAVNAHGYPRYTKDIDLWIWLTPENIQQVLQVIKAFGFGSLGLVTKDFMQPENIIQLGDEPYRIDLLMDVDGADFEDCFARRMEVEIDETPVNFIGLEDLIQVKKKAGRLQDLADAEKLEKLQAKKVKNK